MTIITMAIDGKMDGGMKVKSRWQDKTEVEKAKKEKEEEAADKNNNVGRECFFLTHVFGFFLHEGAEARVCLK